MKLLFPVFASIALTISQGLLRFQNSAIFPTTTPVTETQTISVDIPALPSTPEQPSATTLDVALPASFEQKPAYAFGNPAGCARSEERRVGKECRL